MSIESAQPSTALPPEAETIRIPFWAYLRSIWLIVWCSFRHPLTTTSIDLLTGTIIPPEEMQE